MSIESITDVLSRISSIEQQVQQLDNGSLLDTELGISSTGSSSTSGTTGTAAGFADELAQAQSGSTTGTTDSGSASFGSLSDSALASLASDSSAPSASAAAGSSGPSTGGVGLSGGVTLPASAATELTSGQRQFASTLSADTGLNPSVVTAWLLAEESGSAAQSRQAAGNNDWLNIGYTDSATYGASDSVWSDPVSAANATAEWMQGQSSIPGYGTASSGVQAILSSVGQTPAEQIQALQQSGWSSGGYPSLGSLYSDVSGV
jgi:hypothetical protein